MIDQVILEEQVETNNFTVYTFSLQRNKSEYLIYKGVNLTINNVRNNIINKVSNLKINDIGKDSNGATVSDI